MDSKPLTLSADGVNILGKHYTVSNGFVSKADGGVKLRYNDLLSVEIVKRRSKKAMYAVLLLGCILISVLSIARANVESSTVSKLKIASAQEAYNTAKDVYETVQDAQESGYIKPVTDGIKIVLTILIVLTTLVSVTGAVYLFSGRQFVELTTMRGTYRVAVKSGDSEAIAAVSQLRGLL